MPVSLEKSVIARLSSHGKKFEVLVDPYKAIEVKKGMDVPADELLVIAEVFEDSAKGEKASSGDLQKTFNTSDFKTIAYQIIRKGEVQLTTEQKRKMKEDKTKKIVDIIARRAIDPQRNVPHTPQRILRAMEEARVHVDEFQSAESQVEKVVDALKPIIPISIESLEIMVRVPPQYTGKAYGKISEFGKLKRDEWRNDGSWVATVEIPAGLQGEFYNLLNGLTKGEGDAKVVKKC